jgi:hypothetical protein
VAVPVPEKVKLPNRLTVVGTPVDEIDVMLVGVAIAESVVVFMEWARPVHPFLGCAIWSPAAGSKLPLYPTTVRRFVPSPSGSAAEYVPEFVVKIEPGSGNVTEAEAATAAFAGVVLSAQNPKLTASRGVYSFASRLFFTVASPLILTLRRTRLIDGDPDGGAGAAIQGT